MRHLPLLIAYLLFGVVKAAVTRERRGSGIKETRTTDLNSPEVLFISITQTRHEHSRTE